MSALSFLIKDMAKRGLRVYAAPCAPPEDSGEHDKAWRWKVQARVGDEWIDDWQPHAGTMVDAIKEMELFLAWGVMGKLSGHDWLACDKCDEVQLTPKARGAASARQKCKLTRDCEGYLRRLVGAGSGGLGGQDLPEVFLVIKKEPKKSHHKKPDPNAPKKQRQGNKGYSEAIRLEALELLDGGMSQSQVCRMLKERYPECSKIGVSTISTWKLQRGRLLPAA